MLQKKWVLFSLHILNFQGQKITKKVKINTNTPRNTMNEGLRLTPKLITMTDVVLRVLYYIYCLLGT